MPPGKTKYAHISTGVFVESRDRMARSNMKIANATKIQREIEVIQPLTSGMFSKNLDKLSMRALLENYSFCEKNNGINPIFPWEHYNINIAMVAKKTYN